MSQRKNPGGRPKTRTDGRYIDVWFSDRQIELFNVLRNMAQYGPPPFQAVVEQAIDGFLNTELKKHEVREAVAKYDAAKPKVVKLRNVKQSNGES